MIRFKSFRLHMRNNELEKAFEAKHSTVLEVTQSNRLENKTEGDKAIL